MKDILLSILSLIILFAPTALKVWRDRNGVKHPDPTVWGFIIGGILYCLLFTWFYHQGNSFWLSALRYAFVAECLYASIFPYLINYVHLKNRITGIKRSQGLYVIYHDATRKEIFLHIVSHLSKTAWPDKTWWWRAIGWKGRLIVNSLILIGVLYLYFM